MTSLGKRKFAVASVLAGFKKPRMSDIAKARRNRAPRGRAFIKGAIRNTNELKFVDTAISQLMVAATDDVTPINLIAVGDDNTTRDGRQVTIKSVQIKARAINIVGTSEACVGRALLVWDNAVNSGAVPAATTILTADSDIGFPVVDNANRFTILWDQKYAFGPNVSTTTQSRADNVTHIVDVYKKLDAIVQFSGTTAAIGSIQNGALYLMSTGNAAGAVTLVGNARVRFTDD